jgi:colanic acid biosynthesis protein WcaH
MPHAKRSLAMAEISAEQADTLREIAHRLDPASGLPKPVFDFAYAIVPMVNVDLLALAGGRFLLAWREDEFGRGWHVPGGIFRRGETIAHRIAATAADELGALVDAAKTPAAILEMFGERGHNISFLYPCRLTSGPAKRVLADREAARPRDLRWFDAVPDDLYPAHAVYADLMVRLASGRAFDAPVMLTARCGGGQDGCA